ncbi:MAG: hypothetical protein ACP5MD_02775 [Verrucomicrobiia bacterium]
MSPHRDDALWLKRGRQRAAVAQVLRKPMTPAQICSAARLINPRIQLRDIWFIARGLRDRGLLRCLNPTHTTGKLYGLTDRGREAVERVFGLKFDPVSSGVNWNKYAQVVRAKTRRLVLLELTRLQQAGSVSATATTIRKSLLDRHAMGLNPTIRALKDLERLGLVRPSSIGKRHGRTGYRLTRAGTAVAQELQR